MCLFRKAIHKPSSPAPMPTWEETVEVMYDKDLSVSSPYEIIRVIYSADRTMRYLIIRNSDRGFLFYRLERLYQFDADEWQYTGRLENALPGYWASDNNSGKSIFNSMDLLMNELTKEPEYIAHFA